MKENPRFFLLVICIILSCISFAVSLIYLFLSESGSHERMTFILITIVAFVSCLTFILLLRDARRHEEEKPRK